jgi:hypothetical protein
MIASSTDLTSVVPLRKSVNYAPTRPLLQLGRMTPSEHYVCDALKERYRHFWGRDSQVRREMVSVGELVAHFIAGDQLIERDPWSGGWMIIKPQRQDESTARALNFMQFYITNCLTKWIQSNPDIVAKAARDTDEATMAAKAADIIVAHYESQFYKPWFNLQEGLQALTFGTYINRLRYDAGIKGIIGLREVVENRTVTLSNGAGYCGDCGYGGTFEEFTAMSGQMSPMVNPDAAGDVQGLMPGAEMMAGAGMMPGGICPQCGSDAVLLDQPATDSVPTVVGQEPVELGDLILEQLPFVGSWWDMRRRVEDSSWFIHQQNVSPGAIRRLLGNVKVPYGGDEITDIGQQVLRALGYSGQAIAGRATQSWRQRQDYESPTLVEMWLSPDDYADIKIKGDEETVDGEKLPTGATLGDLFPDGLVAVGLNGFAVTLGLYAENHRDHITSGVWHMKPLSGGGRGVTDTVEVQRRFNKLDSQQLAYMDAVATPAVLYDQRLLQDDEAGYLASPRATIPVTLDQLPDTRTLAQSVMPMSPMSVPGQFVQYVQQFLTQAFSTTSHVTDFTNGGIVGERNDTARAAMIADANANSVFGPILSVKGETRQRIAEMVVEQYREYFPVKRYFALGGAYGSQQGLYLSGADLSTEIRFEITRESELPQNSITKQDKVISFFSLFGGFPGYMQALQLNPELVSELGKLWNVNTQATGFDASAQLCRRRLEQVKQGYQTIAQSVGLAAPAQLPGLGGQQTPPLGIDPQILLQFIQPPISMVEKDQPGKADWFRTWLDMDEGLDAPLEVRAAVELLVQQHFQLGGLQQQVVAAQAGQAQAANESQVPKNDAGNEEREAA